MYLFLIISFKIKNIKIQYANEFVQKYGMDDPTTCLYQFIYYENYSYETKII